MQLFQSGMASSSQANIKAKMNDCVQRVTQFNHCAMHDLPPSSNILERA